MISVEKKVVRRRDHRIWYVLGVVFVAIFLFTFLTQRFKTDGSDVKAAGFDPGYIISDYQMSNYNSMNESQIQAFLKSKNSCNDTNIGRYTMGDKVSHFSEMSPPRTWHIKDGHFVCMADEVFEGGTAAHIIYEAAQKYKINPQVLLVLLEKEQSLVRDTFPHSQQYRSATGYGCPDTAACSEKYYGLKNQVSNAAALFRTVLDGGWTNYPLGNNYVQYNPNAACGGSIVNIRNLATSALYRYTPYQPNAVTLAGGSNNCSAYGNMNFYNLFELWFGGAVSDGKPDLKTVLERSEKPKDEKSDLSLRYNVRIEDYGWAGWINGGQMAGTTGQSLKMEALALKIEDAPDAIEYRTHVQSKGWTDYVADGIESGAAADESLRIEAVQIRFKGDYARKYDVYYRTHVQSIGWTDWAKNDEISGTTGRSLRVEAIQVKIVRKDDNIIQYSTHVQSIGWMDTVFEEELSGTTGESKRIEAIKIVLPLNLKKNGGLTYRSHVQGSGWMEWVKNGEISGTTGQAKRMEAIEIKLISK